MDSNNSKLNQERNTPNPEQIQENNQRHEEIKSDSVNQGFNPINTPQEIIIDNRTIELKSKQSNKQQKKLHTEPSTNSINRERASNNHQSSEDKQELNQTSERSRSPKFEEETEALIQIE